MSYIHGCSRMMRVGGGWGGDGIIDNMHQVSVWFAGERQKKIELRFVVGYEYTSTRPDAVL